MDNALEYAMLRYADGRSVAREMAQRALLRFKAALEQTGGECPMAAGRQMRWSEARSWHIPALELRDPYLASLSPEAAEKAQRLADGVRADGKGRLSGYAIVFGVKSVNLGGFREIIRPQAVTRTLGDKTADVLALADHDPGKPLARQSNGTLKMKTDSRGVSVA